MNEPTDSWGQFRTKNPGVVLSGILAAIALTSGFIAALLTDLTELSGIPFFLFILSVLSGFGSLFVVIHTVIER